MDKRSAKREACWRAANVIHDAMGQGWPSDDLYPDDDERVARAADSSRWLPEDKGITFEYHADDFHQGEAQARLVADTRANQEHIARHDPARVLAEVEAKRKLLDCIVGASGKGSSRLVANDEPWAIGGEHLVKLLALPYADRPGYREGWRP